MHTYVYSFFSSPMLTSSQGVNYFCSFAFQYIYIFTQVNAVCNRVFYFYTRFRLILDVFTMNPHFQRLHNFFLRIYSCI